MSFLDPFRNANTIKNDINRNLYQAQMYETQGDKGSAEMFKRLAENRKLEYEMELAKAIVNSNRY